MSAFFFVMLQTGKLKKKGRAIVDIRKEAIESIKDPAFLAGIVNDKREHPEVRKKAAIRMKEITH